MEYGIESLTIPAGSNKNASKRITFKKSYSTIYNIQLTSLSSAEHTEVWRYITDPFVSSLSLSGFIISMHSIENLQADEPVRVFWMVIGN